jgi:hypothetical protein
MGPEPDKHELALASSPCLHSIWFSYMEQDEDAYAHRSQKVVQQVLAALSPNVEEVRSWRTRAPQDRVSGWQDAKLPMEKDNFIRSRRLRRLEINAPGFSHVMIRQDLKSWHMHADFAYLHTLILESPLDAEALHWLSGCDLMSLKVLNFHMKTRVHLRSSQTILALARSLVASLRPLSELIVDDQWSIHILQAAYQRHGASLQTLRLSKSMRLATDEAAFVLKEIRDQCPVLTDLEINIIRDQGSLTEMAVYKTFATFPSLRRLTLGLRTKLYGLPRGQIDFDDFDKRKFEGTPYGEIRKVLIDQAVDETIARTVFHLVSSRDRSCGIEELELMTHNRAYGYGSKSPLHGLIGYVCQSWSVRLGIRDDRPGEIVIREMGIKDRERRYPEPRDLHPRLKKIIRRIWPGGENGTSDWKNDWHGILQLDGDDVTV